MRGVAQSSPSAEAAPGPISPQNAEEGNFVSRDVALASTRPSTPAHGIFHFSLPSSLFLSPYTINSGLYHNTFSHKKCHRRASLMAPEKMDCFTRSLFKMRPLFLRVARVFLFTGDVCGIDVRGRFRLGLTLCLDGGLDVLCVLICQSCLQHCSFLAMDGTQVQYFRGFTLQRGIKIQPRRAVSVFAALPSASSPIRPIRISCTYLLYVSPQLYAFARLPPRRLSIPPPTLTTDDKIGTRRVDR